MMVALKLKGFGTFALNCPRFLICSMILMTAVESSPATSPISTDSSLGFFTNVASRVLSSELNLNLTQIEVYPTNQYTPAVHRLLQVTANIYDATTTNYYPTVFRPLFSQDVSGNVFITGYTNVAPMVDPSSDSQLDLPVDAANVSGVNVAANVYGVPWIIGAKKGFPNFNAFTMENIFGITRKLQLTRGSTNVTWLSNPDAYTFSQQLSLGITNMFGVECWNSYRVDYTNPITIYATIANTMVLTNDEGVVYTIPNSGPIVGAIAINDWPGYGTGTIPQTTSFVIPLAQSESVLTVSIYSFNTNNPFLPTFPLYFATNTLMPHWTMMVTNRLRVVMVESNAADGLYHVIDYVQLVGPNGSHDLTADITNQYDTATESGNGFNGYNNQWDPTLNVPGMPNGIANQIEVSAAFVPIRVFPYWQNMDPTSVTNEIAGFRAFLGYASLPGTPPSANQYIAMGRTSLAQQAPYTPTAMLAYQMQWQVNDPLVHYLASDLTDFNQSTGPFKQIIPFTSWGFAQLNYRYMPWGGNPALLPIKAGDTSFNALNLYNQAIKDSLATNSDSWDFPNGQPLNSNWLGRVHRGTPWQTIYLKSSDVLANNNIDTWTYLTGDPDAADAALMAPVRDWHLASLLSSMLETISPATLLSINNPDTNAWLVALDGLTALTNSAPGEFDPIIISSNSPQASVIANAIQSAQASQAGQFFRDIGDVLATLRLTEQSPFLNLNSNITDEAYEMIPSQLLPLLRSDSVGAVAITNGQTAIQFSGSDGHVYAIEVSPDLVNWTRISTNCSVGDIVNFTNLPPFNGSPRFYRSVLLK
jgi:hypothetical protein